MKLPAPEHPFWRWSIVMSAITGLTVVVAIHPDTFSTDQIRSIIEWAIPVVGAFLGLEVAMKRSSNRRK